MWHVQIWIVYITLTFEAKYFSISQFGTKWDSLEQNCKKYIFETIWESQTWNGYEIFEGIIVTCNNDRDPIKNSLSVKDQ